MTRVLIIEDEPGLRRALEINLRAQGYEVATSATGAAGLDAAAAMPAELVVLDLGLPDLEGVEVISGLRGWTQMPIIVLSARAGQADKVEALDAGADDYVTKPFGMHELLARMRAAMRRSAPGPDEPVVDAGAFVVDLAARQVTVGEDHVRLTPTEWHLLEILVRNEGRLVGQRELLREVWGPALEAQTNYLRVYVGQLRHKLEPDPSRPRHLLTEPGMGYRFEARTGDADERSEPGESREPPD